jgi:predicted anti-sigma-YlaC factor YlaD
MKGVFGIFRRIFPFGQVDCAETQRLGSDYLENGLSPRKHWHIQAHLDRCGPCRAFIDTLGYTVNLLSRIPRVTPPPSFKENILERVRRETQGH